MPEAKQITFSYKEVVEALVRYHNINEGLWALYVEFGIGGANIGPDPRKDLKPAAIVPILKLGLQRANEPTNLTADASEINPAAPRKQRTPRKKATKKKPSKS